MCFSASASFGMSAVLLAGGIATLSKTKHPSQIPFAFIPLIFSAQQFTEGFLWLSLTQPRFSGLHIPATMTFLIFAQVVWPLWVPGSIYLLEKDGRIKKMLLALFVLGLGVSAYLAWCIASFRIDSLISDHHIRYDLAFPKPFGPFSSVFYFAATVLPPFISGVKKMVIIGTILLVSFLATKLFFGEYLISVWCYYAAGISVMVYLIIASYASPLKSIHISRA